MQKIDEVKQMSKFQEARQSKPNLQLDFNSMDSLKPQNLKLPPQS